MAGEQARRKKIAPQSTRQPRRTCLRRSKFHLAAPLLSGKTGILAKTKKKLNPIKSLFDSKFDAISGGLFQSSPFKYDVGSKGSGVLSDALSALEGISLDPFAVGGQVVNSGLAVKLGLLNRIFNHKKSGIERVNEAVDSFISTKEKNTRTAIEAGVALVDADPTSAAIKNLIFKALIFHLYADASLHAKLSATSGAISRLLGWNKWLNPLGLDKFIINPGVGVLRGVAETIRDAISAPARLFGIQNLRGAPPTSTLINSPFADTGDILTTLQSFTRSLDIPVLSDVVGSLAPRTGTDFFNGVVDALRGIGVTTTDAVRSQLSQFRDLAFRSLNPLGLTTPFRDTSPLRDIVGGYDDVLEVLRGVTNVFRSSGNGALDALTAGGGLPSLNLDRVGQAFSQAVSALDEGTELGKLAGSLGDLDLPDIDGLQEAGERLKAARDIVDRIRATVDAQSVDEPNDS
eukprot:evm.model.scf_441EXC.9 EVM.evm.TU.scf_441EXC.9   scf_441EXC:43726-46734(+)